MRIALVGNGPIDRGHAYDIDTHEFVVRFNSCRHYGETGWKIDALALVNVNSPGWQFAWVEDAIPQEALRRTREVWFLRPPEERYANPSDPISGDFTEDIIRNRLGLTPYMRLDPEIYQAAIRTLWQFGASPHQIPSSGFLALFYLLHTLDNLKVTLYGFTHEGWNGHPWAAERAYVGANRSWIQVPGRPRVGSRTISFLRRVRTRVTRSSVPILSRVTLPETPQR